ncbi:PDZ domain-containing protein [Candidatus Laterigemmans baculatus]|uniref:PDZ domain-containing protein n=1 Tax=Candidatus Laterigemmans baculatus TaxID=2770505 RepID=UPI0013DB8A1D|nr:PDZ domain-containing protein [Candidatus Laterigemmans baculatus]
MRRSHLLALASLVAVLGVAPPQAATAQDASDTQWLHERFAFRVSNRRDNGEMMKLLQPVCESPGAATVQVFSDGKPVALGIVVGSDGLVLTKRSELSGDPIRVRLPDQRLVNARVAAVRREADLALLQADAEGLETASFSTVEPEVGSFLISVGRGGRPIGLGVVSVRPRAIHAYGRLGVRLENDEQGNARVDVVVPASGAHDAGIQPGDQILAVDGREADGRDEVIQALRDRFPGENVHLTISREGDKVELDAQIREFSLMLESENDSRLNGPRSNRLSGFESVLQHDTVLDPDQCGGPILDSAGKVIGVNIARAGRVVSYALPAALVVPLVEEMVQEVRGSQN